MPYVLCPWCARKIAVMVRAFVERHRDGDNFRVADVARINRITEAVEKEKSKRAKKGEGPE
ncbi:MAG: hypothetical protein DDT19_01727 [Syntrophomonadaceae bacterium]|nr:hypothetical protein [Bacillota bacterium]